MLELSIQKEIVDEYTSNPKAVASSLAEKYRCSPATIRKILIRNGVPENVRKSKKKIPAPRIRFTEESKRRIAELYMSDPNATIRSMAKEYECHQSTIWRILKERVPENILTWRRRGVGLPKFPRNVEQEIVSKYINGHDATIEQLAEEYNCASETITRILRENGVTRDFMRRRAAEVTASKRSRRIPKDAEFLTLDKAWILGVLCGDAHHDIKNGRLILESGNKRTDWEFLTLWRRKLEKIYGIKCAEWRRGGNVTGYVLTSRAVSNDIIRCLPSSGAYRWRVPKIIMEGSREVQREFLKAFFDSEACVDEAGITVKSVNEEGLRGIPQLLSVQGITSKITGPHYEDQKKCLVCGRRTSIGRMFCCFCGSKKLEGVIRHFYALRIDGYRNIVKYAEKVGFDLTRKREKLRALVERKRRFIVDPNWGIEEILKAIAEGAKSSMEIAKKTNMKVATVRYYLNMLLERKVLRLERVVGRRKIYTINEHVVKEIQQMHGLVGLQ
jgi:transposase-like protein/predicted transcriptional regulator